MKFRITYNVWGKPFVYETDSVADAFEAIKAVLQREKLMFPEQERAFCDYFKILSDIAYGSTICQETHIFKIEKIVEG